MTINEELAILKDILKLVRTVQNHVQFPPRGGQCWCEQCEAIRLYDSLKQSKKRLRQIDEAHKSAANSKLHFP